MKRMLIFLICPLFIDATPSQWIEHTYANESDHAVKVITHYTQMMQRFIQPKVKRRVSSKKIKGSVTHTLNPHETKTIRIKGDSLSSHKLVAGNINVVDLEEHDHAIVPKHNTQNRFDFVISRNKRDKLTIKAILP
jgi:hypothetical protein